MPVAVKLAANERQWIMGVRKDDRDGGSRRLGAGAGDQGLTYRVEVTAYSANNLRRISRYTRSNRVFYVPFDKLSEQFKRIHREGGKISSITPVT